MIKRDWIAAVVSALVLSLTAISQASAKQTVEVAFVPDNTGSILVADYAASRTKFDQIMDNELPTALRNSPEPQRRAVIEQQSNERKELNAKLAELVAGATLTSPGSAASSRQGPLPPTRPSRPR